MKVECLYPKILILKLSGKATEDCKTKVGLNIIKIMIGIRIFLNVKSGSILYIYFKKS